MSKKLQQTIQNAYDNAPATRARFDEHGIKPEDIQTRADLEKLPVMPKDSVVALQQADPPFGGLLAVPASDVRRLFFSPGPLYEPEVEGDDDTPLRMAVEAFKRGGFDSADIVLNTLSYHLVPAGLSVDMALGAVGATVIPSGTGNSELQIKLMRDLGATAYVGTPSFLMHLIQKIEEMGLDFNADFKIKRGLFSAEPFPPALRKTFEDKYSLLCINAYATAELGLLAVDTEGNLAMSLLPEPIIEVVDPETGKCVGAGEAGEVVVTNFSRAYPLIRLGTGDMAINFDPKPGESTQGERAIALVGRSGEAVKVRGMFVHPNQLRFAAGQVLQFGGIQGVVTRPENRDEFVVRVVSAETDKSDALMAAIQQLCRVKVDAIEFVDAIAPDAPGMDDQRDWS